MKSAISNNALRSLLVYTYQSLIPEADHAHNVFLFCCFPRYFICRIFALFHLQTERHAPLIIDKCAIISLDCPRTINPER